MADQKYSVELDISQFSANVDKLKSQLKQVEDQLGGIDKKKVFGGEQAKNADMFSKSIDKIGSSLDYLPGPIGGVITGVKSLTKALLASGIGAIVVVIGLLLTGIIALGKAFTSTDSGALKFEILMKQIGAVVDVVMQRLAKLATGLVSFFSGDFKKGLGEMSDAFVNIGENMANATKAAKEYAIALDEIDDAQTVFISQEADMNNQIAKLNFIATDQTKSSKERMDALLQSQALEKKLAEQRVEFAQKSLDSELKYQSGVLMASNETIMGLIKGGEDYVNSLKDPKKQKEAKQAWEILAGGETLKKLENLYKGAVEADTQFYETGKRTSGKISGFKKEQASAAEAAAKKEIESIQKIIEAETKRQEELKKFRDETVKIYEDIATASADTQIEATKKVIEDEKISQQTKIQVINDAFANKKSVLEKNAKTELDILQKQMDESKNKVGPLTPEEIEKQTALQDNLNAKITLLKTKLNNETVKNEQSRSDAVIAIQEKEKKKFEDNQTKLVKAHQDTFDAISKIGQGKEGVYAGQIQEIKDGIQSLIDVKQKVNQEYADGLISKEVWQTTLDNADKGLTDLNSKMKGATAGMKEIFSAVLGEVGNLIGMLSQQSADAAQYQLDQLDKQYQGEYKALDELYKKKSISEQEYNKRKEALDKEQAAKVAKIKTEQARKQRNADILQAIVSTALGVIQATNAPPPLDIIMPILVGALGALQIGMIMSKPLPTFKHGGLIPRKYATGGPITGPSHEGGGVPIVAEGGEYMVNRISAEKNKFLLDKINKGGGGSQVMSVDTNAISNAIITSIRSIPVNVVETDITRTQKKVNVIETNNSW